MSKRTDKVEITPQGKVLRYLREKHEFSMREAGERMGYSSSYISQIENGRENPPKGVRLQKFLKVYGGISEKYFWFYSVDGGTVSQIRYSPAFRSLSL